MQPGHIVVVGSANADVTVRVVHRPAAGETVLGSDLVISPGGKGANQAVAAAQQGGVVTFVGCVGADPYAPVVLEALGNAGVGSQHIRTGNRPTGVALITVTPDGENSIIVAPGANFELGDEDVETVRSLLSPASVVVLQMEIPRDVVERVIQAADEAGARVILNAAPARALTPAVLAVADPLILNKTEAEFYLSKNFDDLLDARTTEELRRLGSKSIVVTLGEQGALAITATDHTFVPAPHVDVVDTTGAGDAFVGAVAEALARGAELVEAVRAGVEIASIVVTREGAQQPAARDVPIESSAQ